MARLLLGLAILCLILAAISLTVGPAQISVTESLTALFHNDEGPLTMVMREIRLPRTILAFIVGSGLGLAGAAMQGYLRNPLAEPGLIGVSASAALGAVIAIQTGLSVSYALGLPLMALLGAVIGVFLVMLLAGSRGNSITLILAGIAISALAAAFTSLALNLSPNPYAANEIIFWMMGSLADRSMTHVGISLPFVIIGAIMLFTIAKGLDALTLGEDAASALGINLKQLRFLLVLGTASIVGAITAVAGAISFVGLVIPHILRPLVGAKPSRLLWASALGGGAMVLAADIAVRVILPTEDLKLGVITAILGAPLFLHLIYKTRKQSL